MLKTSKVKLDNKLKNKQFKHQSVAKKYRKEQRKLRQAVKDVTSRTSVPLEEEYKTKHAGECSLVSGSKFSKVSDLFCIDGG